ncbi:hypothetical protein AYO44_13280 [Planctomycetaceae bacterium SCGC AG-212-F19]|nr:hypothetical protein AYO44_13280 [Planctomycetaceae bacterium SCGC AG-212-F19]
MPHYDSTVQDILDKLATAPDWNTVAVTLPILADALEDANDPIAPMIRQANLRQCPNGPLLTIPGIYRFGGLAAEPAYCIAFLVGLVQHGSIHRDLKVTPPADRKASGLVGRSSKPAAHAARRMAGMYYMHQAEKNLDDLHDQEEE